MKNSSSIPGIPETEFPGVFKNRKFLNSCIFYVFVPVFPKLKKNRFFLWIVIEILALIFFYFVLFQHSIWLMV